MEKVISKYQFGVQSTKFGQISKCEVCTKEGQIMGTTNLCQTCLNKAMEKAKHLLKNELVQKQMPRKEERRKRRHSWSFLDRNREEQVPDNPFLPLLPERYKIPKKGTKEEWNGELWRSTWVSSVMRNMANIMNITPGMANTNPNVEHMG